MACALAALAALGALNLESRDAARASLAAVGRFTGGREAVITAHVTHDAAPRQSAWGGPRQVVDVETEQVELDNMAHPVRLGLRLTLYAPTRAADEEEEAEDGSPRMPDLRYGQRLRFPARLRLPRNFGNPGSFDYRGYLAGQNIAALASVRTDKVEMLPGFSGSRLQAWRSAARRAVLERLRDLWDEEQAALLATMLVGERAALERGTRLNFQRTGTYHILVVSGLHVGLLAFVVFWVMRRLRAAEIPATMVTLAVAAAYAWFSSQGIPAQRATLMLALYLGARLLYRERAPLNAIGAAALLLLIVDPRALFDASFQLTFVAVLAIAGLALPLLERTSLPYRRALEQLDSVEYDVALAPRLAQFRLDLRLLAARLARWLPPRLAQASLAGLARLALGVYDVVLVAALMQVALALPMAVYFHRATLAALPANAAIMPLTAILLPSAMLSVALSFLSLPLARVPAMVASLALSGITRTVEAFAALRTADVRLPEPGLALSLVAAAVFVFALVTARRSRWLAAAGLALVPASAVMLVFFAPAAKFRPGVLEVTLLDVGQGDAILVVSPEGRTLLVDAGGSLGGSASEFDVGEEVVSPYLWSRGIRRLDAVALTHAHADHIGGLRSVLANFQPRELWHGPNPPVPAFAALLEQAKAQGVRVTTLAAGDAIEWGGAAVEVLAPPRDWEVKARPRNNDSLAMRVRLGETSALLAGDAERSMERRMVQLEPEAELLKVAHHGSATSTVPEWLAAVRPQYAAISVGFRSPFGHPRTEVLERLRAARVRTFRTDTMGALTFYLDGKTVWPAQSAAPQLQPQPRGP